MMPASDSILLALSPCSNDLMIGIQPATEASNKSRTLFLLANWISLLPCLAISA